MLTRPFATCVILYLFSCSGILNAQTTKCGTVVTPQQVAKVLAAPDTGQFQPQFAPNKCFGKTLSITAHIISDSLGDNGVTEAQIIATVQTLNFYFAPICLSFEVCQFNYIPNYKYDRFVKAEDEAEVIALYSVPKTINIFYAMTVSKDPPVLVGGYAYLPGGEDFIVLSKSSLGSIYHEMGHFFGLLHTFETQYGIELINGSNCATAGDFICDTPADPGGGNTPSPDCQSSPYTQDATGQWYVPNIGNIMSYYTDDCTCGFTTEQLNRMAANYQSDRFYLW